MCMKACGSGKGLLWEGRQVAVVGRYKTGHEGQDGNTHYITEVIAEGLELLAQPAQGQQQLQNNHNRQNNTPEGFMGQLLKTIRKYWKSMKICRSKQKGGVTKRAYCRTNVVILPFYSKRKEEIHGNKQWCWRDIQNQDFAPVYITNRKENLTFLQRHSQRQGKCTRVVACEIINRTTAYLAVEKSKIKTEAIKEGCTLLYAHYTTKRILQLAVEAMTEEGPTCEAPAKNTATAYTAKFPTGSAVERKCWENIKTERNPKPRCK